MVETCTICDCAGSGWWNLCKRYSFFNLGSSLLGGTPRRSRFSSGNEPVCIVSEAGWARGAVWTRAENLAPLLGFDTRTVQSVANCYTDCAFTVKIFSVLTQLQPSHHFFSIDPSATVRSIFFYVHGAVHHEKISIIVQQDATVYSWLYFCKLLYMFRVIPSPIIRSTCKV